jgi:TRAP-type C4-dicarboxylate transport system permease small subunit
VKLVKLLLKYLDKTLDLFTIAMTVGIVLFVSLGIVFRFVLNFSAPWTQEMARYMFIYLTFIGSAIAVRENTHITIDMLLDMFPKLLKTVILIFVQVGIISFLVILTIGSWYMVQNSGGVSTASLRWMKMSHIYFSVFAGSILMIFYTLLRAFDIIIDYAKGSKNMDEAVVKTDGPII